MKLMTSLPLALLLCLQLPRRTANGSCYCQNHIHMHLCFAPTAGQTMCWRGESELTMRASPKSRKLARGTNLTLPHMQKPTILQRQAATERKSQRAENQTATEPKQKSCGETACDRFADPGDAIVLRHCWTSMLVPPRWHHVVFTSVPCWWQTANAAQPLRWHNASNQTLLTTNYALIDTTAL